MKQWYKHNDKFYIIHKKIPVSSFTHKDGKIELPGHFKGQSGKRPPKY